MICKDEVTPRKRFEQRRAEVCVRMWYSGLGGKAPAESYTGAPTAFISERQWGLEGGKGFMLLNN